MIHDKEDLKKTVCYINGEFCSGPEAKMSIFDKGFCFGANTFGAMSLWDGYLIKLESHLKRFYSGMHALKMPIPQSKEEFTEILFETIRRSKLKRATVFCATTFGVFPLNFIDGKWGGPDWQPTLMIYCAPYYWQATFEKQEVGFKCMIPTIRNFPPQCLNPRIKNWDRLNYYLAVMEVKERGADTPIILDVDGYVTEAIGSNVWIVANGKLYTAAEDILYGITREVVFDIARLENIEAITARFTTFELYNADEAFLCSTTGGIMPVTEVDGRIIGSGKPGPITRQIKEKYWKLHVDPAYSTKVPGL